MSEIVLRSSHLYLKKEIAQSFFGEESLAYISYSKEQNKLFLSPVKSQWFTKLFRAYQILLKNRDMRGDKTLAIHEIIIDNELDYSDRTLKYEIIEKTQLIKIAL